MKQSITRWLVAVLICLSLPGVIWADSGPDHQDRETRPIPLGVSGGNVNDRGFLFCCSGTIGALINVGGTQYILSNNHVLAKSNAGVVGDPINQPGNIDVQCQNIAGDYVADLFDFEPINFAGLNTMDAAIAQVRAGQVRIDGFILDIGVPGSSPLTATVGLGVKKSGRTTGLTTGQVATINVTADVGGYCHRCFCLRPRTARFVGQIAVSPGTFSAGGDSGALIVENVETAPRPVALLFAASSEFTVGSPIAPVLAAFGATLVGSASGSTAEPSAGGTLVNQQELEAAIAIQEQYQDALMRLPGVVGIGVGLSDRTGRLVLRIFLKEETPEILQNIPDVLEGLAVETVFSGLIEAHSCVERLVD